MEKAKKTEATRKKIVSAALAAFGTYGYQGASLNMLCSENGISKGLIYHNFKNKDEIYLACVKDCFEAVTQYLQARPADGELRRYMQARSSFFAERPRYARLFFEAILQPPEHLRDAISENKKSFDALNEAVFRAALSRLRLREGVSWQDALAYYSMVHNMFHHFFVHESPGDTDFAALADAHEAKLSKLLDMMLYGIAMEEPRE